VFRGRYFSRHGVPVQGYGKQSYRVSSRLKEELPARMTRILKLSPLSDKIVPVQKTRKNDFFKTAIHEVFMLKKMFVKQNEEADLGFGSYVAGESRQRLINRDGTFNVSRKGLNFFTSLSLYHALLTISWWKFILIASLGYFLMNVCFAFAYVFLGPATLVGPQTGTLPGQFLRAFFFSVQTSSTIGYGHILPESIAANLLVTLESFVGLLGLALVTGIVFARFSRPTAKILFSKNAVIAPYQDISAFEFRIANARDNQILELRAQVHFSCLEEKEGKRKRHFYHLTLERDRVPFFPLSWTIVHPIDKESPLYRMTFDDFVHNEAEFMILLTGLDDTFNQTVYARSSYKPEEIVFGARFTKIYEALQGRGPITINIDSLSDIEKT
jgi:inward rectifier potassium channel